MGIASWTFFFFILLGSDVAKVAGKSFFTSLIFCIFFVCFIMRLFEVLSWELLEC